ncbi:MAG: flagellar protein FliT [Deltaproteobacteria bacterium]|nr:flagellar protein FliT [Deltaproteobacteria bacterium]
MRKLAIYGWALDKHRAPKNLLETFTREREGVDVVEQWQLKRDLFLEMKDLALKQKELVSEERMDLFSKLSGRRQGIQRKISSMKINGPATGNAKESRIRTLKAECARIIESIQEIDGEIERLLSEKRDALMEEIKAVRRGRRALKGYGGKRKKVPRFIDTRG